MKVSCDSSALQLSVERVLALASLPASTPLLLRPAREGGAMDVVTPFPNEGWMVRLPARVQKDGGAAVVARTLLARLSEVRGMIDLEVEGNRLWVVAPSSGGNTVPLVTIHRALVPAWQVWVEVREGWFSFARNVFGAHPPLRPQRLLVDTDRREAFLWAEGKGELVVLDIGVMVVTPGPGFCVTLPPTLLGNASYEARGIAYGQNHLFLVRRLMNGGAEAYYTRVVNSPGRPPFPQGEVKGEVVFAQDLLALLYPLPPNRPVRVSLSLKALPATLQREATLVPGRLITLLFLQKLVRVWTDPSGTLITGPGFTYLSRR